MRVAGCDLGAPPTLPPHGVPRLLRCLSQLSATTARRLAPRLGTAYRPPGMPIRSGPTMPPQDRDQPRTQIVIVQLPPQAGSLCLESRLQAV